MADIFEGSEPTFTPAAGDYIRGVDDPTGTPISGNITITQLTTLLNTLIGGGPSTSGNVLTSNGTAWTSAAPSGGGGGVDWVADANTWSYSSADAPVFVASVNADMTAVLYPGYRLSLTQTTEKFFIVHAVGAYSGGATLITIYGGTDYTLTVDAITIPKYSNAKIPPRMPMSKSKWSVVLTDGTLRSQATPTQDTWYNPGSLSITLPIGEWDIFDSHEVSITASTAGLLIVQTALSTSTSSASDSQLLSEVFGQSLTFFGAGTNKNKVLTITSKTIYYVIIRFILGSNITSIKIENETSNLNIRAVDAYL